jgi:hypothetical protein
MPILSNFLGDYDFRIMLIKLGCGLFFGVSITILKYRDKLFSFIVLLDSLSMAAYFPLYANIVAKFYPIFVNNVVYHVYLLRYKFAAKVAVSVGPIRFRFLTVSLWFY